MGSAACWAGARTGGMKTGGRSGRYCECWLLSSARISDWDLASRGSVASVLSVLSVSQGNKTLDTLDGEERRDRVEKPPATLFPKSLIAAMGLGKIFCFRS